MRRCAHSWAHGVRTAFGGFFNFLASRPALARLLLVEVYAAGPVALERREEALRPLDCCAPRAGTKREADIGGDGVIRWRGQLAYQQVRESGAESLPDLAPLCTYLTAGAADRRRGGLCYGHRRRGPRPAAALSRESDPRPNAKPAPRCSACEAGVRRRGT